LSDYDHYHYHYHYHYHHLGGDGDVVYDLRCFHREVFR
jgi:hypothetical protein